MVTDYDAELRGIESDIEALEDRFLTGVLDVEQSTRYVYRLYQKASLAGCMEALRVADRRIADLIPAVARPEDLYLLQANIAFKQHRMNDVEEILNHSAEIATTAEGRKLHADLLFQRGRYRETESAYLEAIARDRTWDNLARYGHYVWKMECSPDADDLFAEAEDELTSKQMRSFAWLELQRGSIDLGHGRLEKAADHFESASRAYSGYWMVDEHRAGLLAVSGDLPAAAELYESVLRRTRKPEIAQLLAEVYDAMDGRKRAADCRHLAMAEYLDSTSRGEVCYFHHLAEMAPVDEAVHWARRDRDLRCNFATQAALAWALHRAGGNQEAAALMDEALDSGVKDGRLFSRAAEIYHAAGRSRDGQRLEHKATVYGAPDGRFHAHPHS